MTRPMSVDTGTRDAGGWSCGAPDVIGSDERTEDPVPHPAWAVGLLCGGLSRNPSRTTVGSAPRRDRPGAGGSPVEAAAADGSSGCRVLVALSPGARDRRGV